MIDQLIGFIVEGIVGALFHAVTSRRRAEQPRAIREAVEAATMQELERLSAWGRSRGLEARGDGTFAGSIDGVRVAFDPGCDGSSPRGAELVVAIAGLEEEALGDMESDPTLDGALRSIAVTPHSVRLRFVARRSPEAFDVALRFLRDVPKRASGHRPRIGIYR